MKILTPLNIYAAAVALLFLLGVVAVVSFAPSTPDAAIRACATSCVPPGCGSSDTTMMSFEVRPDGSVECICAQPSP